MTKTAERRQCGWCGKRLPPSRANRRYCGPTCRFHGWRRANGVAEVACTYCGIPSDTKDHVPAQSVRPYLREHAPGQYPELEVPCCRECNSHLGARGFTLQVRRRLAREALERKYRDILGMPHWSESELAAMGDGLARDIRQNLMLREWLRDRLRWSR